MWTLVVEGILYTLTIGSLVYGVVSVTKVLCMVSKHLKNR